MACSLVGTAGAVGAIGPVTEELGREVGAIGPDDGAELRVVTKLAEECQIFQRFEYVAIELAGQIDFHSDAIGETDFEDVVVEVASTDHFLCVWNGKAKRYLSG